MKQTEDQIIHSVEKLIDTRGWEQYHVPHHLIQALSVECSELMNACLWRSPEEIDQMFLDHDEQLMKEMADIAINFFSLVRYCDMDISECVEKKVDELITRYHYLNKGDSRNHE